MSFIDSLSRNFGETAKKAVKKSGEVVEITKLNLQISNQEDKANQLYSEIGKKLYNKYNRGDTVDAGVVGFCEQVDEIEAGIRVTRRRLADMKNTRICPECKAEVKKECVFCPKCGEKV